MDTLDATKSLEEFLAAQGIGDAGGGLTMTPLGDGHSNLTYLLDLGGRRVVLRRPPEGPLPPSAHDVIREADLLRALGAAGLRVPRVLASHDDDALLGAPFFVMELIEGPHPHHRAAGDRRRRSRAGPARARGGREPGRDPRGRPGRAALYFELSGRAPADMRWYRALALFRAAVFLEGSYKRFRAGTTDDAWFASLESGVPELGRLARRIAATG